MHYNPFFINSNLCIEPNDLLSFELFMDSVAGNTGNSYITYSLIKACFGSLDKVNHIQNIYTYDFTKRDKDIDYINNNCSHVFLILQDQIRIAESYGLKLPYKGIQDFVSKLNKPVIIAGLGANSFNGFDKSFHQKLNPDLINFLKFLSDHCINIGIRGHFTEEVLHNIGVDNTTVIGCPSFFEMGKNRKLVKKDIFKKDKILLTSYLPIEELKNNYQIMQDFQEQKIIKAVGFESFNEIQDGFEIKKLREKKYRIFSNIEEWKSFVSNFDFAIGNRLHGSILSINSGVPAICCNMDSRATEMCNYLKIPHIIEPTKYNIMDLYNSIDVDLINNSYPRLYERYLSFLNANNVNFNNLESSTTVIKFNNLNLYSKPFTFTRMLKSYFSIFRNFGNKQILRLRRLINYLLIVKMG